MFHVLCAHMQTDTESGARVDHRHEMTPGRAPLECPECLVVAHVHTYDPPDPDPARNRCLRCVSKYVGFGRFCPVLGSCSFLSVCFAVCVFLLYFAC